MSINNNDSKRFIIYQLKWLGIYMGVSLIISLLVPFPVSLIAALAAFIMINFYRRQRIMKRYGIDRMKNLFGSLSSSSTFGAGVSGGYSPLKYFCMNCGEEHKETACPRCGSKMKRVG